MQGSHHTDEQLAIRLQNGDAEAITLIYERFKNGLFLFCVRLLSDPHTAEDVVHETMVKMIGERSRLRNPASLKSWIFTIARNEAYEHLNKNRNIRALNENDENIFLADAFVSDYETAERTMIIEMVLDRLRPQYKEVLILREYESMTYEEIAGVTGATVSSVKSRLFKARKALMEKLKPLREASAL